ncbi:MAG TPA: BON domain-containing protein [Sulfuricaulis sp.]|nr:BON domain-containing protein [Sulfuricaulis sp.]
MLFRFLILTVILGTAALIQACAPVIVAGGATAAVVASDRRTVGAFVDDENIEIKARKLLTDDRNLGDDIHVNITSVNGNVLLSGEALTAEMRDQVVDHVRSVQGIRRVVNEINVAEPTAFATRVNDGWITTKVKSKLLNTENIQASHIKVVTENSVVYLMGLVKQEEGNIAAEATRTVGSIKRVVKLFEYTD